MRTNSQRVEYRLNRDFCRVFFGISVNAGRDSGEGDAVELELFSSAQAFAITVGKSLGLAFIATRKYRPNGVNDIMRAQLAGLGGYGLAGRELSDLRDDASTVF